MLFMRCAFESRQEKLALYPFPGLKIINIRGSALLALDLIIIGSFVSRLADQHRLLELALRDYPLDMRGLIGLLPCIPLVRTVTICLRRLTDPKCYYMLGKPEYWFKVHNLDKFDNLITLLKNTNDFTLYLLNS